MLMAHAYVKSSWRKVEKCVGTFEICLQPVSQSFSSGLGSLLPPGNRLQQSSSSSCLWSSGKPCLISRALSNFQQLLSPLSTNTIQVPGTCFCLFHPVHPGTICRVQGSAKRNLKFSTWIRFRREVCSRLERGDFQSLTYISTTIYEHVPLNTTTTHSYGS